MRDFVARAISLGLAVFSFSETIIGGLKMQSPVGEDRRVKKSVSLPAAMIRAIEERAKRERRSFSSYVHEALELLDAGQEREVQHDQH